MGNDCSASNSVDQTEHFLDFGRAEEWDDDRMPDIAHPKLVKNLVRRRADSSPFRYYEEIGAIGEGSAASVSKVKRRSAPPRRTIRRSDREGGRGGNGRGFDSVLDFVDSLGSGGVFRSCSRRPSLAASEGSAGSETSAAVTDSPSQRSFDAPFPLAAVLPETAGKRRGAYYALKSVSRKDYAEELRNEIKILTVLDHPCIVKPIEMFEQRHRLFLVEELCAGGDLYYRDPYTTAEAARIISSILSAVDYMHERNVLHRDLKYENVMFIDKSPQSNIKIIDFGLSKKIAPGEYLTTGVGTIYTMAPEVLMGKYSSEADVWSVGVLLYMLLSSQMPFYGGNRRQVIKKIVNGSYDFKGRGWNNIPRQAKEFVSEFLQADPNKRPTAREALHSDWLREYAFSKLVPEEAATEDVRLSLNKFVGHSLLKKVALLVLVHNSTSDEVGSLRDAFQKFDSEMRGAINLLEFKTCLAPHGYSEEEIGKMFRAADIDGTGFIEYTEFLAATLETHGIIGDERLQEAFDFLDTDGNGLISDWDIHVLLGEETLLASANKTIVDADLKSDVGVSYEEFCALFQ